MINFFIYSSIFCSLPRTYFLNKKKYFQNELNDHMLNGAPLYIIKMGQANCWIAH